MYIDLKDLFNSDVGTKEISHSVEINEVELSGINPFETPIEVVAKLQSMTGSVLLTLDFNYKLMLPCDRCAEEVHRDEHKTHTHILVNELSEDMEEDETYILVEDEKLDLDELVYTDVVLDLPNKYLCKDDCKGLCDTCGKNLNDSECTCDKSRIDPRLEVLGQLLDK